MSKRWDEASAYVRQARSNQALADFLFQQFCAQENRREEFWCHVVAQSQQSVEKAIKALICFGNLDFPKTHRADQLLFFLLKRSSFLNFKTENLKKLSALFGAHEKQIVKQLSDLAPQKGKTKRNTEYPFLFGKVWVAPATDNVFTLAEIQMFIKHSRRIAFVTSQIISANQFLP
ncbi:HEPN domain-containing protein [bacterium]|nr:HEPN domain-containing protein [bacterium]